MRVKGTKPKHKNVQKGRGLGHVTYFFQFWDPLISLEWLKLQTLNCPRGLSVKDIIPKMKNWSREFFKKYVGYNGPQKW